MKLFEDKSRLRRLYISLVNKAQSENGLPYSKFDTKTDYEIHHITPLSWGASDHPLNLVRFTYRQHYIAHLLLSHLMETKKPTQGANSRVYAHNRRGVRLNAVLRAITPEAIERTRQIAIANNSRTKKGVSPSPWSNARRSETLKAKQYTCPHCGTTGGGGLLRWHFEHCKHK